MDYWVFIVSILVDTCPFLTVPEHAEFNTTLAVYGTYLGMQCLFGYYMVNHTVPYVIQCLEGRLWSSELPACERKLCVKARTNV